MQEQVISDLTQALINLDIDLVKNIFKASLSPNSSEFSGNERILIESQKRIGDLWETGDVALSQVYMAGMLCNDILDEFLPNNFTNQTKKGPIYVVVLEDYHFLGAKMLISILKLSGYNVIDYGIGVSVENLVQYVQRDRCEILMISTLMLHSALKIELLIKKLKELQLKTRVIVGGAPFNIDPKLWLKVGANATASTASKSIPIVERFLEEQK
ncbi:B12-binding domain-containing protein [Candidatus Lokiarchaeum ossiferum]|uniref:B12-binding domain-containing protein n=1 Tax=Candidatus Lokiarchaeum ossiferum TaxID=2951803 RepID=UPI00352EE35E